MRTTLPPALNTLTLTLTLTLTPLTPPLLLAAAVLPHLILGSHRDGHQQIYNDQSLVNVENDIASVKEVFRLQRDYELREAENKYLPKV